MSGLLVLLLHGGPLPRGVLGGSPEYLPHGRTQAGDRRLNFHEFRDNLTSNGLPWFAFAKADRRVTCYYFYLWDEEFGPAFVKVCAYFPYPVKIWVNGHEWAKRQATVPGSGSLSCPTGSPLPTTPPGCSDLRPARAGPHRGVRRALVPGLPLPLTDADAAAGYWWEISMRQVEVSRTIVFTAPRHARGFFEALVADNLDIGRPEQVELIFTGKTERRRRPRTQPRRSRPRSSPAVSTSP